MSGSDPFVVPPPKEKKISRGKVARFDGCSMRDWNAMLAQRKAPNSATLPRLSEDEVRSHNTPRDVWIVIRGVIYDCTAWGRFHPGGLESLMDCAGRDGTALFDFFHPWVACDVLLAPYAVGVLDRSSSGPL